MLSRDEVQVLETMAAHLSARSSALTRAMTRAVDLQRRGWEIVRSGGFPEAIAFLVAEITQAASETEPLVETVKRLRAEGTRAEEPQHRPEHLVAAWRRGTIPADEMADGLLIEIDWLRHLACQSAAPYDLLGLLYRRPN